MDFHVVAYTTTVPKWIKDRITTKQTKLDALQSNPRILHDEGI